MGHSIMSKKAKPANNVVGADPKPSTFWQPKGEIEKINFYYGFNRREIPQPGAVCEYKEAKKSYGTHGGFEMICNKTEFKIKFGNETKTEPFNSRLIWALGYNVTPVDYVKDVYIKYDRKILTEYNLRKDLFVRIKSLAGFNYYKHNIQKELDPFADAIAWGRLKNGEMIHSPDLKKRLLKPESQAAVKIKDSDINAEFEAQIESLVLQEGNIEVEDDRVQSLGPWSWNDFDHSDRRELRGFAVVAAFLNLFDVRTDNNRLRLVTDEKGRQHLRHDISDVGSGLGSAENLFRFRNAQFNDLPWEFIRNRPTEVEVGPRGKGTKTSQTAFAPIDYRPLDRNMAFEKAQLEDAQWAARRLARVSESQFVDAMVAAGFTSAEVAVVLEKLLSRRQNLLKTLGLDQEFPEVMSRKVSSKLNYDSAKDPVFVASGSSERRAAPASGKVVSGQLVP